MKKTGKILGLILSIVMVFAFLTMNVWAAEAPNSGTCGTNVTWAMSDEGVLTISGTGAMDSYSNWYEAPWYESFAKIKSVVVEEGVTSVGSNAFEGEYKALTSVTLPDSLDSVGAYAFHGCEALKTLELGKGVTKIGLSAFSGCKALESLTLPDSLTYIGNIAFSGCTALTGVTIPANVTAINYGAFSDCNALKEIVFAGSAPTIGDSAFSGVTSMACYPIGDATWTESVRQGYGGTLTWVNGLCGDSVYWSLVGGQLTISGTGAMAEYEFSSEVPWHEYRNSITTAVIGNGVTSVSENSIEDCKNMTELDVSGCTTLKTLFCDHNSLTSLDVSGCTALEKLACDMNKLKELDLSKNTALKGLYVSGNDLKELNLSKNTVLTNLYCINNALEGLDVSKNTALTYFNCSYNALESLDVSKDTALTYFDCSYNALESLDVSGCTALTSFDCSNNALKSLDVSKNTALTYFNCSYNALESLDVSKDTELTRFDCSNNALKSLDVSGFTVLNTLYCYNNALTELNLYHNTALENLAVYYNPLTEIDISDCPKLVDVVKTNEPVAVSSLDGVIRYDSDLYCDQDDQLALLSLAGATVTLSQSEYIYDGKAKEPWVRVTLDGGLVSEENYKVSYENNVNAGTATVTVAGKGNYGSKATASFKIKPIAITPSVTLSASSFTWNGKAQKPSVTVKDGKTKVDAANYTVSYKKNKNVGKASVTVTMKGNLSGTKTVAFTINPKGTTVKKLKKASKAITVKWNKQAAKMSSSRINGYTIQAATDSKFKKNKKTVTVKGYSKASKKITGLKGGKKYYVRIRTFKTVGGKKYYSPWSKAKTVKTKK